MVAVQCACGIQPTNYGDSGIKDDKIGSPYSHFVFLLFFPPWRWNTNEFRVENDPVMGGQSSSTWSVHGNTPGEGVRDKRLQLLLCRGGVLVSAGWVAVASLWPGDHANHLATIFPTHL